MSEMKKRRSFSWTELSRELKRRHVYTVVATYAVVSWMLLQIGEVTFGPLHLPEWVMSRLVVLVIIGFPIVVVLAWFFDLTRKGIRLTPKLTLYSGEEGDDRPSIAVLPFADMSPERDQGYFCEGLRKKSSTRFPTSRSSGWRRDPPRLSTGKATATCASRPGARGEIGARGQRSQIKQSPAHHGPAGGRLPRLSPLEQELRQGVEGHLPDPG
jgi:Predicted integral membrane protein